MSHLIGHEGRGSILSLLKAKGEHICSNCCLKIRYQTVGILNTSLVGSTQNACIVVKVVASM